MKLRRTAGVLRRQISICNTPHCSYLAIYISQKIRLCVVDFEGQFQTSLQAESINFLISKFKSIIPIFLLFFAGIVKSTAFCTLSHFTAIPKRLIYLSHVFVSNHNSNISTPWNSSDNVQKAVDLTTPAKNRRNMSIKDLNFQIKKFMDLACRLF